MSGFDDIHRELRAIMIEAGAGQVVSLDEPGNLVVRTTDIDAKTGEPGWFGTVTTRKGYVAYHLMPLYADPSLGSGMSEALARRRQGKSCFNFKTADADLFAELAALTRRANGRD